MMKYLSRKRCFFEILIASLAIILLASCTPDVATRIKNIESVALTNNFQRKLVKGGDFVLTTYQRIVNKDLPYVFYIEGDGLIGGETISCNPTPSNPIVLGLASLDERPNVVYIARPCQYTPLEQNPKCTQSYWTDKRMAEEVIHSINVVIDSINNGQKFSLVGFSGGGGVAALIAARNKNVKEIITIAGNLDHVAFNKYHNVRPMTKSLNPIDYATQINNIPQLHLSGNIDKIVPSFIAAKYVKLSSSNCVQHKTLLNITHTKGWSTVWQDILKVKLPCQ